MKLSKTAADARSTMRVETLMVKDHSQNTDKMIGCSAGVFDDL